MRYNFPLGVHGEEATLNGCYSVSRAVSVVNVFSASLAFISPDPLSRPVRGNPWALAILLWCWEGFRHTGWVFRTKPRDACSLFHGCLHLPIRPLSHKELRGAHQFTDYNCRNGTQSGPPDQSICLEELLTVFYYYVSG